MQIKVEMIVAFVIGGAVGYAFGRSSARAAHRRAMLENQVFDVSDVEGVLTSEQSEYVTGLLEAGHEVISERVGNLVMLLARHGTDQAEKLFTVPAANGNGRQTLREFERSVTEQGVPPAVPGATAPDNTPQSGDVIDVGPGADFDLV